MIHVFIKYILKIFKPLFQDIDRPEIFENIHNVSVFCAVFHPYEGLFLSCSEDKSIRLSGYRRLKIERTYYKKHQCFWALTSCPTSNMFAAGHDGGLLVFTVIDTVLIYLRLWQVLLIQVHVTLLLQYILFYLQANWT